MYLIIPITIPDVAMTSGWSESDYFKSLSKEDKQAYKEKLQLKNGTNLPDPFGIERSNWRDDVSLLPDVGWGDIHTYLVDTPSPFTNESLKAYKSLEAYNYFICGHVQDVYYCGIEGFDFCFLKSKVRF